MLTILLKLKTYVFACFGTEIPFSLLVNRKRESGADFTLTEAAVLLLSRGLCARFVGRFCDGNYEDICGFMRGN